MKRLVLLNKCDGLFTGFITILPESFNILVEGHEESSDMEIHFNDNEEDRTILSVKLYVDEKHARKLECFGTLEHIAVNEAIMERVSEDIAYFADNNAVAGYEDEPFQEGVVPMELLEEIWSNYLCEQIDSFK